MKEKLKKQFYMVKISVIVPIYNISSYIVQCVESIVNQTYKNLEIILVNDGSTDDSLEKVREWEKKDNRIVVVDKPNGGLSDARNAGMSVATGDYVSFVDGDDWIGIDLYEKVASEIDAYPNIDVITFSIKKVYPNGKEIILSYKMDEKPIKGADYFRKSNYYVNAWSKIYRREFVKDKSFVKGLLHEDIPYTVVAINEAERVANLNDVFYYYRQDREGSILNTYSSKKLHDWLYGLKMLLAYAEKKHDCYLNKWILDRVIRCCTKARRFKDYKEIFVELQMQEYMKANYSSDRNLGVKYYLCANYPMMAIHASYIYYVAKNRAKKTIKSLLKK